jgi:hypothetical protein
MAEIRGSLVAGVKTTIAGATRAAAFGLDDATHTHTEDGKFIIYGDLEVTGTTTISTGDISDDLDALGT